MRRRVNTMKSLVRVEVVRIERDKKDEEIES
jgi:hypothetical protein